ncbi:unnamed protein product [Parajaminaea phylloscopi]
MVSDGFIHACAGGAGGMIAMSATYPLVSISMRAAVEQKKQNKGALEAASKILAEEGLSGLYSGLSSSLLGISITNFVYYGFFETAREAILASKNKGAATNATSAAAKIAAGGALSTAESMLAGALAGSATTIITNPIWVVNTRQTVRIGDGGKTVDAKTPAGQRQQPNAPVKKLSFLQTIQHIIKTDGVTALWRGIGPALFLVINPILQYTAFEQLKNLLVNSRLKRGVSASLTDFDFFILGALSKLFATGLTYPQVLVKSRQQAGSGPSKSKRNFFGELAEIVKREGISGLYRGLGPKLTQSVLTAAILFSSQARLFALFSTLRKAPQVVKA